MAANDVRGNAPVPTPLLAPPPTLAAEVLAEAALRRMQVGPLGGVMARLWLELSRAKRAGLERGERVGAGTWTWVDGEPAAHNELIGV